MNLVIFGPLCIDSRYLVSAAPHTILYRSFWNFAHVFSMVWRCACGLDIILALIFITFSALWTCHFLISDCMKVYRQWVPCEGNSSYNFIPIFLKLCTCFLHGLEICIWFGYNPWINFCHFFHFVNFVIFWPQIVWKCIDSGYLVSATPYTISYLPLFRVCATSRQCRQCEEKIIYATLHIFFPWFEDVHVVWI